MKKQYLILFIQFMFSLAIVAENYPYRSDFLWVTVPDHADWLYKTGEDAVVDIQLYKYGMPCEGVIDYEVANDMYPADKTGKVDMKNGHAKINIGTKSVPGFRDLKLKTNVGGDVSVHHVKVGFSVDKIKAWTKEPSDFIDFWNTNVAEMRREPLQYTITPAPEYTTEKIDCSLVKVNLNKEGQCVYAYLFKPKGAQKGQCPAVLCPPGAGVKTIKEPLRHKYYAENGCIRMEMEIHGLDPRLSDATFKEIGRALNGKGNGYLENGIDNRDRYYMKRVYLAVVRCLDLITSLPEWDGRNLVLQGGSQGGALSIIGAALDSRVTLCIANHPALSDMGAYSAGLTGGYPHFNRTNGMMTKANLQTMAYYDVVNFARHVKATTYLTWGYNDETCPPTTSYAVWNELKCNKESLITPINEHWTSDRTERRQMEWMLKHLR